MIDFTKTVKPEEVVAKTTEIAIKTIDLNHKFFKDSIEFFDDITNKAYYTYTVQTADAVKKVTEYAKEALKTKKVPDLFVYSK